MRVVSEIRTSSIDADGETFQTFRVEADIRRPEDARKFGQEATLAWNEWLLGQRDAHIALGVRSAESE